MTVGPHSQQKYCQATSEFPERVKENVHFIYSVALPVRPLSFFGLGLCSSNVS